jgi:hypothetical protein
LLLNQRVDKIIYISVRAWSSDCFWV